MLDRGSSVSTPPGPRTPGARVRSETGSALTPRGQCVDEVDGRQHLLLLGSGYAVAEPLQQVHILADVDEVQDVGIALTDEPAQVAGRPVGPFEDPAGRLTGCALRNGDRDSNTRAAVDRERCRLDVEPGEGPEVGEEGCGVRRDLKRCTGRRAAGIAHPAR